MTEDSSRVRLNSMINLRHPMVVLTSKLPLPAIKAALAAKFVHQDQPARAAVIDGLFGVESVEFGDGVKRAGGPRLPIRLMAGLLYLKNSFNFSDEELVQRRAENVYWQNFCGLVHFEPRLPCDATQRSRPTVATGACAAQQVIGALSWWPPRSWHRVGSPLKRNSQG